MLAPVESAIDIVAPLLHTHMSGPRSIPLAASWGAFRHGDAVTLAEVDAGMLLELE